MVIINLSYLLFASALTMRKETTIYYSRIIILTLLLSCFICYNNLYVINLEKGIGLYGGIFNVTPITQSFNIFILLVSSIILVYNSFYHRTLMTNVTSWIQNIVLRKGNYNVLSIGDNKMGIYRIIEYPLIILFIISGALFLMSSGDLISIFISIELQSYGLYILSTLHRDSEQATWGGLTYFLLGGLSSCFILLGSALLYINSGTTSLDGIYIISTITDIIPNAESWYNYITSQTQETNIGLASKGFSYPVNIFDYYYINISLIILSVGFLFKISAAPFHFWSPDVYDAIPTSVTTYVAIIAKISIFIFLLELVYFINKDVYYFSWKNCLLISSLFSLIIGSVLGLTQFRIKRVYAYSTISHVGFILLALCVNNTESIQAYIFYIISYTISNLNAFVILVTIGYTMYLHLLKQEQTKDSTSLNKTKGVGSNESTTININSNILGGLPLETSLASNNLGGKASAHVNKKTLFDGMREVTKLSQDLDSNKVMSYSKTFDSLVGKNAIISPLKDINNSPIQLVNQLKGYFYINSYLALSLAITLFSFIGIPPLIGFFAKQMVLSAALDNGYIFITLVGILTSVIGAVYYLNIVKQMFFFNSDYVINPFINTYNFFGTLKGVLSPFNSKRETLSNSSTFIFNGDHIKISSALSSIISIMTLLLLLFIFIPNESFNLAKILTVLLFN